MQNYRNTEYRKQSTYHSYDYILERQIGRPSKHTAVRIGNVQKLGIFLTGLVMMLLVLSITVFINKEPVEASDGVEYVKNYICIEVEEGDSLWSLAAKYKTEDFSSLESFVAEMEEINGMNKDTVLKPGNKLMIPCYREISR